MGNVFPVYVHPLKEIFAYSQVGKILYIAFWKLCFVFHSWIQVGQELTTWEGGVEFQHFST